MLTVTQLSKSFEALPVLRDVSFEAPRKQFVCLLGGSGCGKTTLLRIIAGLTTADAGQIVIDGNVVRGPGQDRSMVFQNYGLLPWRTVLGNVEFGLELRGMPKAERRRIAHETIVRVGLAGFDKHYPHQISGGMQQRVALARAFSKNPSVLLMDEPFAAVDMQTREMLQEELLKVWMEIQTTVVFVTHSIEEAVYLGDRVIVMASKPPRVAADVLTEMPRPRPEAIKTSARFQSVLVELRDALRAPLQEAA